MSKPGKNKFGGEKMKQRLIHAVEKFLNLIILFLLSSTINAQENLTLPQQKQDSAVKAKDTSQHSLYTSIGYGNNMVYMGTSISQDKPFYFGTLTYGYNNEFYASVSTYHLSAFDPLLAFNTFSLSYNHDFNSWLDISLGISRYQVASELTDTLFNNFFYGDLAIGFDWNILYTNLSVGGIFSESSSAYFQLRNSRYFQTQRFNNGKAYFSFDPYLNMLFGTLTKTVTADGTTIGISPPFGTGRSSVGGNPSGTTTKIFSLMEIDLGLPVGFTIGKLTVEAEPGYVIPLYSETDILNPQGFTLLLNCYFRIF